MTDETEPKEESAAEGPGVDRRRFLGWTWKALAAGLAVEAGWTTYDVLVPRPAGGFGGEIEAGSEVAFPEGEVRYFPEGRMYVTRVDGELVALFQKCPHLGCRVPFCDSSGRFECPCHGSVFNRKGEYLAGPAPRGMDSFPIRIQDGEVLVDTGEVVEGPPQGELTLDEPAAGPSCLGEGEGHDEGGMMHEHEEEG
ncbi:MAG TPA: Rieske 2Fe-2S domain-containing protein [Longimicrobiales bacterium]|nr:Rieske 2Fe-2S domain-containing protein [Longimicrobiales bacterium]